MHSKNLAIMFTDMKGYTARTSRQTRVENEAMIRRHKELIYSTARIFAGTIIKSLGDSFLITYESCTNAVLAGLEIQKSLSAFNNKLPDRDRIEVRISISAGDVRVEKNDVFGEAVNIASRLEKVTGSGQVLFTDAVFYTMNRSEVPCRDIGTKKLSGIPYDVRIFEAIGTKIDRTVIPKSSSVQIEKEKIQTFSLDELLREVLISISPEAAAKNVQVQVVPIRSVAKPISGTPIALRSALKNFFFFAMGGRNGDKVPLKVGCSASIFRSADLGFTKALMDCVPRDLVVVPENRTGTFRGDPTSKIEIAYTDISFFKQACDFIAAWEERCSDPEAALSMDFPTFYKVLRNCRGTLSLDEIGGKSISVKIKFPSKL